MDTWTSFKIGKQKDSRGSPAVPIFSSSFRGSCGFRAGEIESFETSCVLYGVEFMVDSPASCFSGLASSISIVLSYATRVPTAKLGFIIRKFLLAPIADDREGRT